MKKGTYMKKIGLVGGTGPESTLMYYKELNSRIDKITDGKQMPEIVIESVDFRRAFLMKMIETLWQNGFLKNWK